MQASHEYPTALGPLPPRAPDLPHLETPRHPSCLQSLHVLLPKNASTQDAQIVLLPVFPTPRDARCLLPWEPLHSGIPSPFLLPQAPSTLSSLCSPVSRQTLQVALTRHWCDEVSLGGDIMVGRAEGR